MEHIEQLCAPPRSGGVRLPQRARRWIVSLSSIGPLKRRGQAVSAERVDAHRDYPILAFATDAEILVFAARHRRSQFYEPVETIQRRRL